MEIRQEVLDILNDNKWRLMCYKFCKDELEYADDLYQEFALALLETSPKNIDDLINKNLLELYSYRILKNMWCSNTSAFYVKFRKRQQLDVDRYIDINTDDRSKQQIELYNELMDIFHKSYANAKKSEEILYERMTRIWLDVGSFRKMEEELGINHQTCYRYVKRFRDAVKSSYNKLSMATDTLE